jgi:hypothetical protein
VKEKFQADVYNKVKLEGHEKMTLNLVNEQRKRDSIIMQRVFNESTYMIAENE